MKTVQEFMRERFFPLPNQIFSLGLKAEEIAIYGYLMSLEDRKTYQCHPSYKAIGRAVGMTENTVRKYIRSLEAKGLIYTEPTTIWTKDGRPRNGNLRYTIRPIQEAIEVYHARQMAALDAARARQVAEQHFAKYNRTHPDSPVVITANEPEEAVTAP